MTEIRLGLVCYISSGESIISRKVVCEDAKSFGFSRLTISEVSMHTSCLKQNGDDDYSMEEGGMTRQICTIIYE